MMDREPQTVREWQQHHYEVEADYARCMLQSPKDSPERRDLFQEAYTTVIGDIIERCNPGGASSDANLRLILSTVNALVPAGASVIDVGCGDGSLVFSLLRQGYDASGLDVSMDCIVRAKEKLRSLSAEDLVEHVDVIDYQPDRDFDCIVLDNVIEHLVPDTITDVLSKCYDMLGSEGYLIVLTPHRFSGPHDISYLFLPLGAKAEGFHLKEFSFTDLEEALREAGFQQVLGFPIHPRLIQKIGVNPRPSTWAARKARYHESISEKRFFSSALTMNRTLTRAMVAMLFPAVCVGAKKA